jgi:hypothetical protein
MISTWSAVRFQANHRNRNEELPLSRTDLIIVVLSVDRLRLHKRSYALSYSNIPTSQCQQTGEAWRRSPITVVVGVSGPPLVSVSDLAYSAPR